MHIYMIGDQYRVDGVSGRFVEEPLDASLPIYEDVLELHTARNQYVSFQIVLDAREEGKKNRKILLRMHRCLFERLNAPRCGIPPETFAPELEGAGKYIKVRS